MKFFSFLIKKGFSLILLSSFVLIGCEQTSRWYGSSSVQPSPMVLQMSPDAIDGAGGTILEILVRFIDEKATVLVDGIPCDKKVITAKKIVCTTPPIKGPRVAQVKLEIINPDKQKPAEDYLLKVIYPQPVVQVLSPKNDSILSALTSNSVVIAGSCSEEGMVVKISGSVNKEAMCVQSTFSLTENFSSMADGLITLTAMQTDTLGVESEPSTVTFLKDTVAPLVSITSPAANSYVGSSIVVSGSCSEDGIVLLQSGLASVNATCLGGIFSGTLNISSLADGAFSVTADQLDKAGNAAVQSTRTFNKDTVLPTVAILSPVLNSFTNNSITVFGSCSENGRMVNISGAASGSMACTLGGFSIVLDLTAVPQGSFILNADHSDLAGNNAIRSSRSFIKDTMGPVVQITSPASNSYINSSNQANFVVSGICETGLPVSFGGSVTGTAACLSGAFSAQFNLASAPDGAVNISVSQTDTAGNLSSPSSRNFIKVSVLPVVTFNTPASNYVNLLNYKTYAVAGTCSEAGQNVVITGDASATVVCQPSNTWSATLNFILAAEGNVSVVARTTDSALNASLPAQLNLVLDKTIPTVTVAGSSSYVTVSNQAAFSVTGTCSENGQLVTLKVGVTPIGQGACAGNIFSISTNLSSFSDGVLTLRANHSDAAGNIAIEASTNVTKDSVVPTVAITAPVANTQTNAAGSVSFVVTGTCSENGRTVKLQTGAISVMPTCSGNAFSGTLDLSTLSDGPFTITADHSDVAGNPAAQSSRVFIKDSVPPVPGTFAASTSVTSSGFTLNWTLATDNLTTPANLKYLVCSGPSLAQVSTVNGCLASTIVLNWTNNVSSLSQTGSTGSTYYFNVLVKDLAGNVALYAGTSQTVPNAFVSTWKTDNVGTSNNQQITLPLEPSGTYNFTVEWGDGTLSNITAWNDPATTHTYSASGTYTVGITGVIRGFRFNFGGDKLKLMTIRNWGPLRLGNSGGYFYGASNLTISATDSLNLLAMTNFSYAFAYCSSLVDIPGMNNWDTGAITDMSGMFYNATLFNGSIGNWNMGNVSNLSKMFFQAIYFNQPISNWNLVSATNMSQMFLDASFFNQPIGTWNVLNVTDMSGMFYSATSFNQDINSWNVGNVTNMSQMFSNAQRFNQPLNNWNVSKVVNMSYMFLYASAFNQDLSLWNVSNVIAMSSMFAVATQFNGNIGTWNVSNVVDMSLMFAATPTFNQNLSNWNVSKVLNMYGMFSASYNFNGDISTWNVSSVTDMSDMFNNAGNFNQNISGWNVSNVRYMNNMFNHAASFNQDISNWNVSKLSSMIRMFSFASSFNQSIGNWNVSNVTDMSYLFYGNTGFNKNIGTWNVSNVTNMLGMFYNATAFNQNISAWNVSKVTNMAQMFYGATAFNQDLGSWNVSNVTGMSNMLQNSLLSQPNYDSILIGWSAQPLKNNVSFSAGAAKYSPGAATIARSSIISNFNWTIVDGGQN